MSRKKPINESVDLLGFQAKVCLQPAEFIKSEVP